MTVKEEALRLTPQQREGRAINAVAELLRRTLSVPNIYLDPPASLISAEVLAVDRGGAGDLHAVEIELERNVNPIEGKQKKLSSLKELKEQSATSYARHGQKLKAIHRRLMSMPAHFRYLAIPADGLDLVFGELGKLGLFAENGIGRLGIIAIKANGEASPTAELAVVPERFRVDPSKLKNIETKLLDKGRPDIEVRI